MVNPLAEQPLLDTHALQRWAGLPLGWAQAATQQSGRCATGDELIVAMLDTGRARARFRFGARTQERELSADAIGIFAPGQHPDETHWTCHGVRRILLRVDHPLLAAEWAGGRLLSTPLRTELEVRDAGLSAVLRAMVREVALGCPQGPLYAESLSIGVALGLHRWAQGAVHDRDRLSAGQMRRVADLVQAELSRPLSLVDLATAAGLGRAQFARLFKATQGCTPHRYVVERRLEHARRLISGTRRSLADIASEAGFSSQSHMTSAFSRLWGTTPGALRRAGTTSPPAT